MIKTKNSHGSPRNPETAKNLVQKGAYVHGTGYDISIPPPGMYLHDPRFFPVESQTGPAPGKTRIHPVIWEARRELIRRGLMAIPVRGGSVVPLDIIAWDDRIIYCIAVRRSRGEYPAVQDITTRYDPLIKGLRAIRMPGFAEVQLWISIHQSFQVYEILAGGLMSRSLP